MTEPKGMDAVESLFDLRLEQKEEHSRYRWARILELVESPIERMFLGALVAVRENDDVSVSATVRIFSNGHWWKIWDDSPFEFLDVYPQYKVGPYSADFLLTLRLPASYEGQQGGPHWMGDVEHSLVVECDGHEFHEKTKKQAARDKKRDRVFAEAGITVLRFSGSEIFASPGKCALESVGLLQKRTCERVAELRARRGK